MKNITPIVVCIFCMAVFLPGTNVGCNEIQPLNSHSKIEKEKKALQLKQDAIQRRHDATKYIEETINKQVQQMPASTEVPIFYKSNKKEGGSK